VASHLVKLRGTSPAHIESCSSSAEAPVPTISARGTHIAQVATFLARYNRTGEIRSVADPLGCVDTTDRYAVVETELANWSPEVDRKAHLVYELMVKHGYDGPGLDHENRLVVVAIGGAQYVVADLGMRMLVPRELFRAMGFPDSYVIDPIGPNGKTLSKTAQIRACGNSVPPQPVEALIAANFGAGA
jgi:DNA (cytosine-5)-methyltransferase 1